MTKSESLEHFKKLIAAALTLGVAGLKGDQDYVKNRIPGERFQFEVPCSEGRAARRANGGCSWGALRILIDWICEMSGAVAPHASYAKEAHVLKNSFVLVTTYAPNEVSAHEVLEAVAVMTKAFQSWGVEMDKVQHLLELA